MDGFGQFVWTAAAVAAAANFLAQLCVARRRLTVSLVIAAIPVLYAWATVPESLWTFSHLGFTLTIGAFVYAFTLTAAFVALLAAISIRSGVRALSRRFG